MKLYWSPQTRSTRALWMLEADADRCLVRPAYEKAMSLG